MICLGIESTAHTFGVGIVTEWGEILANVRNMYSPPKGWGIDPSKAKEHHEKVADKLIEKALEEAHIKKPDLIAVAIGPGLPPCLLVGLKKAKELAKKWGVPIVGVNHAIAHLEIGKFSANFRDPVMLYVSGGNTQIIAFEGGKYRVFGETEDMGIGNLFDSFGRLVGLEFPAGPKIEKLAKKGERYIEIPYSVKGMDVSFAGIYTKLKDTIKKNKLEDVCFSLQETTFAMLVEVTERAMAHTQKNELILTGGVSANKRLQEMCRIMCEERGASFSAPPIELAGDNGAMIAWNGILAKKEATKNYDKIDIKPKWRVDEVKVSWIEDKEQ
ncbi:MAG: bifunctional N(6)-L-threonylcarbamoyladenine synthase/serine/threonine protein kinase [Nanoarchaeota archaeon]|nr:bifunctional N(6)-L-threonylcarbamoyladenine synthase/serine/threonine protein kinase [Nanoarchaeota archaeon]